MKNFFKNDNDHFDEEEEFRKKIEEIKRRRNEKPPFNNFIMFIIISVILFGLYQMYNLRLETNEVVPVTYTNFVNKLKTGDIKKLIEKEDKIIGKGNVTTYTTKKITQRIGDDNNIMSLINENPKIELISEEPSK